MKGQSRRSFLGKALSIGTTLAVPYLISSTNPAYSDHSINTREIVDTLRDKVWNLYKVNSKSITEIVNNGPAEKLVPRHRYMLLPSVNESSNPEKVMEAYFNFAERNKEMEIARIRGKPSQLVSFSLERDFVRVNPRGIEVVETGPRGINVSHEEFQHILKNVVNLGDS